MGSAGLFLQDSSGCTQGGSGDDYESKDITLNLLAVSGDSIPDGPEDKSPVNRINPDQTVAQVCSRIQAALDLDPLTRVELVYGTEKLLDNRTISSYKIADGDSLTIVQSKVEPPKPPMMYYYVVMPQAAAANHQAMVVYPSLGLFQDSSGGIKLSRSQYTRQHVTIRDGSAL